MGLVVPKDTNGPRMSAMNAPALARPHALACCCAAGPGAADRPSKLPLPALCRPRPLAPQPAGEAWPGRPALLLTGSPSPSEPGVGVRAVGARCPGIEVACPVLAAPYKEGRQGPRAAVSLLLFPAYPLPLFLI